MSIIANNKWMIRFTIYVRTLFLIGICRQIETMAVVVSHYGGFTTYLIKECKQFMMTHGGRRNIFGPMCGWSMTVCMLGESFNYMQRQTNIWNIKLREVYQLYNSCRLFKMGKVLLSIKFLAKLAQIG